MIDAALFFPKWLQLAVAVVNDANRGAEAKLQSALSNHQGILRIMHPAADHGVDIHVKVGVFGEHLELLVENFQALLGNVIWIDVINRNLQPLEPGAIQAFDPVWHEQVAIRDHPSDAAVVTNAPDDLVQFGMQQRLAAADSHDGRAQFPQLVYAAEHDIGGHSLGEI